MIYGEPFTGKSTLAASVAELGFNVLWITFDKGYGVLKKLPAEARKRIQVIIIPDTKDNPVGIRSMLKIITGAPVAICDKHGEVGCRRCQADNSASTTVNLGALDTRTVVVIDPISMVAESALQVAILRGISQKQKDANGIVEQDPNFFKPGYDQYMLLQFMMNNILTRIQAAPYHCICISHVVESSQEDNVKKLVPVLGSAPYSINAYKFFDHIILARIVNGKYTFGSTARFFNSAVAGSRNEIELEKVDPPTLLPFFDGTIPTLGSYGDNVAAEIVEKAKEIVVDKATAPIVVSHPINGSSDAGNQITVKTGVLAAMSPSEAAKAKLAMLRAKGNFK